MTPCHVKDRGFTLIELLVVIAIIAILSVVVILTLNPSELLRQSRDSNRLSDLQTINSALGIYSAQGGTSFGSANTVYVSVPDPTATSTAGDQCQGLGLPAIPTGDSYFCAATSTFRNVNGTGWIPIGFSALAAGAPFGSLPIDPANQTSTNLFYTYATNGTQFQLTAHMESQKYIPQEYQSGGADPAAYTIGSNLSIAPYITGMVLHFDASNNSNLLSSSACTGQSVTNGGNVGCWLDTSGWGDNATSSNSPVLASGGLNGLNTVHFNGSNSELTLNSVSTQPSSDIFIVFNSTGQGGLVSRWPTSDGYGGVSLTSSTFGFNDTGLSIWYSVSRKNADVAEFEMLNNVPYLVWTSSSSNIFSASGDPSFHSVGQIGWIHSPYIPTGGNGYLNGDIAEIIMYDRVLSAQERISVTRYLGAKWGITVP